MKKIFTIFVFAMFVVSTVFAVSAVGVVKDVVKSNGHPQVSIPENAVEVAEGVFNLGHAIDGDGSVVEGLMFIHNKKENAKPPWAGGGKKSGSSTCYSYLAKGAKWKSIEPYLVDPSNNAGLNEGVVRSNLAEAIDEWDTAADYNILGDEGEGVVDRANIGDLNEKNEVMFADIAGTNTIAVTIIWGVFSGPPSQRRLVEWDQVYDDFSFDWSLAGEPGKMDFENIAQHELGHSVGMGHSPTDSACINETMYPTAGFGETKKRTLHDGDKEGILKLY